MLAEQLTKILSLFESATRILIAKQNILSFVIPVMEGVRQGLSAVDEDQKFQNLCQE